MFTEPEKKYLLAIARRALVDEIFGEEADDMSLPAVVSPQDSSSGALCQHCGAFVTLFANGELRGCLGLLKSDLPLTETIAEMARRAATEDPRFDPVSKEEVEGLTIELSVLSPFKQIAGPEEITIGRDGLMIEHGRQRGLLLPQVAEKYEFSPIEFLEETCVKAGLPRTAWMLEAAHIYSFTAEVIGEEES
ncbi:MAG TPA: AmmeMemoRadiSam system protein A [Bacteroidota bacterium]|nr:AmmeMemoRadiSam system protein A [Bacteroidota bacterium]